jgi:hypothetical protein
MRKLDAEEIRKYDELLEFVDQHFERDYVGRTINRLELIRELLLELKRRRAADVNTPATPAAEVDVIDLAAQVAAILRRDPELVNITLLTEKPEINVNVRRKVIELDGTTLKGRLARMIAEGWFDEAKTGNAAYNELVRLGFSTAKPNVYRELDKLAELEFLTKEPTGGFQAVAGMKVNIREVAA